jgi:hypothetical protein
MSLFLQARPMPLSFQAGPRASRLSSSSPSRCQSGPTRQRTACPCSDSVARLRAPWPSRDRSGPAPPHDLPATRGSLNARTRPLCCLPIVPPLKWHRPYRRPLFPMPPLLFRSDHATSNPPLSSAPYRRTPPGHRGSSELPLHRNAPVPSRPHRLIIAPRPASFPRYADGRHEDLLRPCPLVSPRPTCHHAASGTRAAR